MKQPMNMKQDVNRSARRRLARPLSRRLATSLTAPAVALLALLALSACSTGSSTAAVTSVAIQGGNATMLSGGSRTFVAQVQATGGASQAVTWRSSTPAVATIDSNGTASALMVGATVITATSVFDPTKAGSMNLAVVAGGGSDGSDNGELYPCTGTGGAPAVLCVRAGAGAGGDGSAAAPFASINAAIAGANAGDIVQVAAGTYPENVVLGAYGDLTDRNLKLLGGFDPDDFGVRDASVNVSLIDGGFLNPGVRLHVWSAGDTVLDGFQITRGRGLGLTWEDGYGAGGGVYVEFMGSGRLVVSNNVIYDNETAEYTSMDYETRGGGIHADYMDWGEDATGDLLLLGNVVRDNRASRGAGINVRGAKATIVGNLVADNQGHGDHGGGIYISTGVTVVEGNIIRGNVIGATAGYGWGGGALVAGTTADFRGNLITDNYAPAIGSGVFWDEGATGTMRNDLIVANRCPSDEGSGAAIYVDGGAGPSHVTVVNATIADHDCPGTTGGAIYLQDGSTITIRDSILWNNTHEFTDIDGGSHAVTYSITAEPGMGNTLVDPLFADAAAGDYHLRSTAGRFTPGGWVDDAATSPALDAGDPSADYALEPLPNGGRVNLGAYGNTAEASKSP